MEGFFAGESVPVNRKLSEIFLQLHISEKTGRGVPLITERYGREAYEFRENSIVVTIPFRWINIPFPVCHPRLTVAYLLPVLFHQQIDACHLAVVYD